MLISPMLAQAADTPVANHEQLDFFEKKIRPVLMDRCYKCHSIASGKNKGGLLLDSRDGLIRGGASGPAIVPGYPEKSLLLTAIRQTDDDLEMPPEDKLSPLIVADFETWIKFGAADPRKAAALPPQTETVIDFEQARKFWSFQRPRDFVPPEIKNKALAANPVDHFVLARLEEKGLTPAAPADKRTLIRRATFDLIGLPPKPEEIDEFLRDQSPQAYENLIERLLASPHYGERWGRHWLDIARYADTAGESADYPLPQAFRYRNYVIEAFNQDKPYDQFIREQIAGDLLPFKSEREKYELVTATGFIALSRRFSVRPENVKHLTIEDTLDTVGRGILGLTLSCARCHDHKFDPIPAKDYYALYGIFDSTRYPFPGSENDNRPHDLVPLVPQSEIDTVLKPFETVLEAANQEVIELEKERRKAEREIQSPDERKLKVGELDRSITAAKKKRGDIEAQSPKLPKAYAVVDGVAKNARVQRRGDPANPGDEVPRGFLQILGGQKLPPDASGSGRMQLASWLTDAGNPLTARVMVNRIWQHHFGGALVSTPSDFGKQGRAPTHPELLDYLAVRFVESGWSIKTMHRLMMLARTYQLSSDDNPRNLAADPANELLWKYSRRRLDAEIIRDSMLAVSGDLNPAMIAGHPFPPQHKWGFTQHNQFTAVYPSRHRSVYLMSQRIKKHPFLAVFDGPDPNTTTAARMITTTPLQALFMMNDPFAHQQSELFAERLLNMGSTDSAKIIAAYRIAMGRAPESGELQAAEKHLERFREHLKATGTGEQDESRMALASLARALFGSNEFIFVD